MAPTVVRIAGLLSMGDGDRVEVGGVDLGQVLAYVVGELPQDGRPLPKITVLVELEPDD